MNISRHVLLDIIRQTFRRIRKLLFTRERPDGAYFAVHAELEEVKEALGKHSFAPNWEFSYNYRGEDLNLAQVVFHRSKRHPNIVWWQTHVRGWEADDTVEIRGHWEPEPTEHDEAHLQGLGFEKSIGMMNLRQVLEEEELEFDKIKR